MSFLSRIETPAYTFLRVVAGAMFALHGARKLLGFPTPSDIELFSQMWFGGVIELIGGALIVLGLFTRVAAFLASGTMAVAYFQFHWKLQLDGFQWLPGVNDGELSALYAFVFLFVAARGAGPISMDRLLRIERTV